MSSKIFEFGQELPQFAIPVMNERAIRAAAGMLFFVALISFMNAWLLGNFQPTRWFVLMFLIEFGIRIFVNPQFAPAMILGAWMVRKQTPEWTGAPQKRFAWGIGFVLAALMTYSVVIHQVVGPINLIVCSLCLLLLFYETAFGICIGCQIYNLFNKEKAQLCPGGVCELPLDQIPKMSLVQGLILLTFAATAVGAAQWVNQTAPALAVEPPQVSAGASQPSTDPAEIERCKVPEFAKLMGHEDKWKLHNHCK